MTGFILSACLFFGIIIGWAWRVERKGQRQREALRSWFRENVPEDEIPRHLR